MFKGKRVVVTMTTYPAREKVLENALKSIISQKEVDEIAINLSIDEYPQDELSLPDFLRCNKRSDKISITYLYGNTKPFKKLIPTLNQKRFQDCIVITCDDDCLYPDGIFGTALSMYNGDRPVCFNIPRTYNWGNGRLSIYEYKFFGEKLNLFERKEVWDTNNDDVAYGFLLYLNGCRYEHKDLDMYRQIVMLDRDNDMHYTGLYSPYKDNEFMKKYILNRFGLSMGDLSQIIKDGFIATDTDRYKKDNTNEIVE